MSEQPQLEPRQKVSIYPSQQSALPLLKRGLSQNQNHDSAQSSPQVVLTDRLPPEIEHITDCNELRRQLLQLMKQTKQMEFRVRKEEEKLKKSGDQLLLEAGRSNETIM